MKKEATNRDLLKRFTAELGVSLFGIADVTEIREEFNLDKNVRDSFDRGLSLGQRLIDSVLEDIVDKPTPLYFHLYRQVNFFLDRAAFLLSSYVQDMGYKAVPIPASQIINWDSQQAHLSHKRVGRLAGLGWIGRNNMLVSPEFGSQFRLVTILTDMPLKIDQPLKDTCGACHFCMKVCPAQAIKENSEDFDHIKCFDAIKGFQKLHLAEQYICGVCLNVCRGNKKG